jgi:MATE family multidrug resistance protein
MKLTTNGTESARTTITTTSLTEPVDESFSKVAFTLGWKSIPNMIVSISNFLLYTASLHFIGSENNPALLNGVGVGTSFVNCTTIALIVALDIGLVSIASQTFGAKKYKLFGLYIQRALIINFSVLMCCFIILLFTKYILQAFGMEEETADYAAQFIRYNYVYLFEFMLYDTLKIYLNAQGIFYPQMMILATACGCHWCMCYYFVEKLQMSFYGVSLSLTITQAFAVTALFSYICIKKPNPQSWFWFSKESLKDLGKLLKYEVAVGAMVYLNWITYEIVLLFSSSYPYEEMTAQLLQFMVSGLVLNIQFGLASSLNALTGIAIGQKNVSKTKKLLKAAIFWAALVVIIGAAFMYFGRYTIGSFFTDDAETIQIVAKIVLVYLVIFPANVGQTQLGSYIRGIGKGHLGSMAFIASNYIVGLPLAFLLGNIYKFYDTGLWIGIGTSTYIIFFIFIGILVKTDISLQVRTISKRITEDDKHIDKSVIHVSLLSEDAENQVAKTTSSEDSGREEKVISNAIEREREYSLLE